MLKLYKQIENQIHYWETWDKSDKSAVVHWGVIGEKGSQREEKSSSFSTFRKNIQKEIDTLLAEGYHTIDIYDHVTLLIEYSVTDMGVPQDLDKRNRLQERMDQTSGWTGLGHCDGGSIGSGTMEVCCLVVDFTIAKNVIVQDLKDTEFSNYTRIFDENA